MVTQIGIPQKLVILITLHLNEIYGKIPVRKEFMLRFLLII
jgi:hypothetical protein